MSDPLEDAVKNVIAEILEIDPADISTATPLSETSVKIDSVAMLEILVTVERRFQITIQEDEMKAITGWQSLIDLVRSKKTA